MTRRDLFDLAYTWNRTADELNQSSKKAAGDDALQAALLAQSTFATFMAANLIVVAERRSDED